MPQQRTVTCRRSAVPIRSPIQPTVKSSRPAPLLALAGFTRRFLQSLGEYGTERPPPLVKNDTGPVLRGDGYPFLLAANRGSASSHFGLTPACERGGGDPAPARGCHDRRRSRLDFRRIM